LETMHQLTAVHKTDLVQNTASKSIIVSSIELREELLCACLHAGYSARFVYAQNDQWQVIYDECNTSTMLASDVRYDGAAFQSRSDASFDRSSTSLSDEYDFVRDGRVWCVEVEHEDNLIVVQRAQRHENGVVTKVGSSMIVGNCFQSPEQWRDDDEERLTEKTDVYSFGGILLEVLTDRIPWFEEKSKYAIYQHVVVEKRGPPIPPIAAFTVPPMLIDLIRWCQAHEPEKRPSFPEILRVLREVDDSLPPD
jgi:serine/threonine protein kinase